MSVVDEIIGQDETTLPGSPGASGVWLKTHIRQVGHSLVATTYMVVGGDIEVMNVEVDLRPIVRALVKGRRKLDELRVSGAEIGRFAPWELFTKDIPKAARSIGRSKLVKTIYKGAKGVVKSKITGAVLGATAIAFPPVGVPAAAAYAGANALVGAVEEGKRISRRARKTVSSANRFVKNKRKIALAVKRSAEKKAEGAVRKTLAQAKGRVKKLSAKAKRRLLAKMKQKANAIKKRALAQTIKKLKKNTKFRRYVKKGKKLVKKAEALTKSRKVKQSLKKIMTRYTKAKDMISKIQQVARYGSGLEKLQAQKLARIIKLVGRNRAKLRTLKQAQAGGLMGMVINKQGLLSAPQRYVERTRKKGVPSVLFSKGGEITTGDFIPLKGKNLGGVKLKPLTVRKKAKKTKKKISAKTRRAAAKLKKKLAKMPPKKRQKALKAIANAFGRRRAKKRALLKKRKAAAKKRAAERRAAARRKRGRSRR